jgi:hypothetical protein
MLRRDWNLDQERHIKVTDTRTGISLSGEVAKGVEVVTS